MSVVGVVKDVSVVGVRLCLWWESVFPGGSGCV